MMKKSSYELLGQDPKWVKTVICGCVYSGE